MTSQPPIVVNHPSWMSRNWKWAVPTICLGGLVLVLGLAATVWSIVLFSMRSSDVYTQALAEARSSQEVAAALGTPIREGYWVSGKINVTGPSGDADLAIPIAGSHGRGTIYVVAKKSAGMWRMQLLEVAIEGRSDRIRLREDHEQVRRGV